MKVIDLLNKIANGEEVPNEIIQHCKVFEEDKYWVLCKGSHKCYEKKYINNNEDSEFLFDYLTCDMLTDEIEIIEENKKIEKLDTWFSLEKDCENDNIQYANHNFRTYYNKINEIIDRINNAN